MTRLYKTMMIVLMSALLAAPMSIISQPKSPFPAMNEAEMKQLEAEMATFQKEIDALNPAEQEAFFKSMEEAVQKIDNLSKTSEGKALLDKLDKGELSDEELDKLINQIVEEPTTPEPVAPPVVTKPEVVEKPAPKPVITSKQQAAADMINEVINHTNSFMVKMAITHELPGKVKNWRKKGYIAWTPNLTLNKFKADIEKLAQQLSTLIEKDRKTKTFIHLDNLLANESLYNNLKKVHRVIVAQEPKIEEALPFSGTMTASSKSAFQKTINQYIEALYTLDLPAEIKQLISKFDPTAKALSEQEDAIRKQADAAHRKLTPGAPIVVGAADYDYPSYIPDYDQSSYSSRRSSSPRSYGESYKPEFLPAGESAEKGQGAGGKAGRAGAAQKGAAEAEGAEGKKDKEKGTLEALMQQANETDKILLADADKLFKKISVNLDNAADTIKRSTILSNIQAHLTGDSDVDIEFATEVLPELIRDLSLRKGALGSIQQMEGKLPPAAINNYKKKLAELFDKYKKQFEPLFEQLSKIESDWDSVAGTISAAKKYAYFGTDTEQEKVAEQPEQDIDALLAQAEQGSQSIDDALKKAVEATQPQAPVDSKLEEIKRKVPTPYSLKELLKNLTNLKSAIEKFGTGKAKAKAQARRRR